jgi:hypothetical protein
LGHRVYRAAPAEAFTPDGLTRRVREVLDA